MALTLFGYCHCCEKFDQPFTSHSGKIEAPKCDHCLQQEKEKQRRDRVGELRMIIDNQPALALLLLEMEEKIASLEAR